MPVDRSSLVIDQLVVDCYLKSVAPVSSDSGPRVRSIDQHALEFEPISLPWSIGEDQSVLVQLATFELNGA